MAKKRKTAQPQEQAPSGPEGSLVKEIEQETQLTEVQGDNVAVEIKEKI